jgi:rare lipoprotein A (peptidoglycan hydrolase)
MVKRVQMKAKTKRRIIHVLTKKKLVKRKTSKHILRTFLVLLTSVSMGSLAYGIAINKPVLTVAVHSSGAGGVKIEAPVSLAGPPTPQSPNGPAAESGRGSWYALGLPQPDALTCASRTFPRGTYLLVKDLYNNHTMVCLVNDYGPEIWTGRIIDLSRGSFTQIDSLGRGTIPVELRVAAGPMAGIPIINDIASLVGYDLCATDHTPVYCDAHRQE